MIIDGAGGYYDPADMPGLAGFIADADARGHRRRKTSEQISRAARSAGGDASASAPASRRRSRRSSAAALTDNARHRARD